MADTKTLGQKAVSAETAAGVSQFLTPVVHNLVALSVNAKQAHWNIRGNNFLAVHEFLDQVQQHAIDAFDTAAERIIALGLPVDARLTVVAEESTNPVQPEGFQQSEDSIRQVLAQLDAAIEVTYRAIDELDDIDLTSQDIAIAIGQQLDKDRWFLYSYIAE
jgi:starvation-inducible DNA-binding protein